MATVHLSSMCYCCLESISLASSCFLVYSIYLDLVVLRVVVLIAASTALITLITGHHSLNFRIFVLICSNVLGGAGNEFVRVSWHNKQVYRCSVSRVTNLTFKRVALIVKRVYWIYIIASIIASIVHYCIHYCIYWLNSQMLCVKSDVYRVAFIARSIYCIYWVEFPNLSN
jgi:hypothetical protein